MSGFTSFELRPTSMKALRSMGISEPTPIQVQTLKPLLEERDVIGQARTGSGKTLAFSLPLIEFVNPSRATVQALVLTPTRELAVQVGTVLESLAQNTGISVIQVFGGRSIFAQQQALRKGPQVVVGAPGRVLDLVRRGDLKLDRVHYLVLDEADEMLDRGFAPDVERILAVLPGNCQKALFSATLPEWVLKTATRHLKTPVRIQLDTRPQEQPDIEHVAYDVPEGLKGSVLRRLLDQRGEGAAVVFGRTKHGVRKLGKQLAALGYPAAALQGNLSQNARDRVMVGFRSGEIKILLATNVAARGLDVDSVDLVINYELPETAELLTHRVGRTGRMGRKGRAITLLAPSDLDKWKQLAKGLTRPIHREPLPRELGTNLQPLAPPPSSEPEERETPAPRRDARSGRPASSPGSSNARSGQRTPSGAPARPGRNTRPGDRSTASERPSRDARSPRSEQARPSSAAPSLSSRSESPREAVPRQSRAGLGSEARGASGPRAAATSARGRSTGSQGRPGRI